jgi:hypothetical protein
MALWSTKKEPDDASRPAEAVSAANSPSPPAHPLEKAAELLGQVHEQIASYLVHSQPGAAAGDGEALRLVDKKLSALAEKLDRLESRLSGALPGVGATGGGGLSASAMQEVREAISSMLAQLQEQLQSEFQELARLVCPLGEKLQELTARSSPPEEPQEQAPPPASHEAWERAILGDDLAANPALALQRNLLIDGILTGEPGACALAGELLVFQSSPAERLPQLLKDIGEAYYRWQPKTRPTGNPMENALVAWLQRCCEAAGIPNTIELVHPGERFDIGRHTATGRGVEITEVQGWIVLRDNGKVYMKATVSVR